MTANADDDDQHLCPHCGKMHVQTFDADDLKAIAVAISSAFPGASFALLLNSSVDGAYIGNTSPEEACGMMQGFLERYGGPAPSATTQRVYLQ
jgi:hypothetical protein